MKKVSYILLTILGLSTPTYAAITTVVQSGTAQTTPLTLSDEGDGAIIEQGGAIATAGTAITMENDDQTVLNRGNISTTGGDSRGIVNNGGSEAVITNSGSILTKGLSSAFGIFNAAGLSAVITNSGQISTEGVIAHGIFNQDGRSAVITNSGQILTTGNAASGIQNTGADAVITNSGQILTTGDGAFGIADFNKNAVITNSGLISTEGNDAFGILAAGSDAHIINSGTVRSEKSFTLRLIGSNPTVSLLRGSNLQGLVQVGNHALNLNVETGLNLALTLDSTDGYGNLGIEVPFVVRGNTVGVIDPTGLALQADVVADLSDTILGGIYRHRGYLCNPCECGVWVQGIGSYRKRSYTVGYDNWQGGFLIGYDTCLCGGNIGLFTGISFGEAEVDQRTQKADTTSYVGGLTYERVFCNTFLGLAVAVGYVDWDNERFVMNNMARGGIDKAQVNTGGMFVSPEVTLSHRFASFWLCPSMSFTLRYAGLFLGSYKEKGSLTDLSIKDREIGLLTTRLEFSVPCCTSVEPYVGVAGRYQVGGYRVDAELLGKSLSFNQGGPRNLVALLLGVRAVQSFDCFDLFLNVEASFDSDRSSRVLGEGGVGFRF